MRFKLLLKIVTFFEHFWNFSQDVSVSLSNLFFKKLSSEAKEKDKPIRLAWTDLMLIPIWNFERKLKMMLNLRYLLHLFHILAIIFCSKFQLIRYWYLFKGNSILYNFYRNRENQISTFSKPKMQFKLLLKIMTFFDHFFFLFFFFLKFSWIISLSISKFFSKEQINKMP